MGSRAGNEGDDLLKKRGRLEDLKSLITAIQQKLVVQERMKISSIQLSRIHTDPTAKEAAQREIGLANEQIGELQAGLLEALKDFKSEAGELHAAEESSFLRQITDWAVENTYSKTLQMPELSPALKEIKSIVNLKESEIDGMLLSLNDSLTKKHLYEKELSFPGASRDEAARSRMFITDISEKIQKLNASLLSLLLEYLPLRERFSIESHANWKESTKSGLLALGRKKSVTFPNSEQSNHRQEENDSSVHQVSPGSAIPSLSPATNFSFNDVVQPNLLSVSEEIYHSSDRKMVSRMSTEKLFSDPLYGDLFSSANGQLSDGMDLIQGGNNERRGFDVISNISHTDSVHPLRGGSITDSQNSIGSPPFPLSEGSVSPTATAGLPFESFSDPVAFNIVGVKSNTFARGSLPKGLMRNKKKPTATTEALPPASETLQTISSTPEPPPPTSVTPQALPTTSSTSGTLLPTFPIPETLSPAFSTPPHSLSSSSFANKPLKVDDDTSLISSQRTSTDNEDLWRKQLQKKFQSKLLFLGISLDSISSSDPERTVLETEKRVLEDVMETLGQNKINRTSSIGASHDAEIRRQIIQLTIECNRAKQEVEDGKEEYEKLRTDQELMLKDFRKREEILKANDANMVAKLLAAEGENSRLILEISSLKGELNSLKLDSDKTVEELNSQNILNSQLNELGHTIETLNQQVLQLKSEKEEAVSSSHLRVSQVESNLAKVKLEWSASSEKLMEEQWNVQGLEKQIKEFQEREQQLSETVENLSLVVSEKTQMLERASQQIQNQQSSSKHELEISNAMITSLQSKLNHLEEKQSCDNQSIEDFNLVKSKLRLAEETAKTLEETIHALALEKEKMADSFSKERLDLSQKIEVLRGASSSNVGSADRIRDSELRIKRLEEDIGEWKEKCMQKTLEIDKLRRAQTKSAQELQQAQILAKEGVSLALQSTSATHGNEDEQLQTLLSKNATLTILLAQKDQELFECVKSYQKELKTVANLKKTLDELSNKAWW